MFLCGLDEQKFASINIPIPATQSIAIAYTFDNLYGRLDGPGDQGMLDINWCFMSQGESAVHAQEVIQGGGRVRIDGKATCRDIDIGWNQSGKAGANDDHSRERTSGGLGKMGSCGRESEFMRRVERGVDRRQAPNVFLTISTEEVTNKNDQDAFLAMSVVRE